MPAMTDTGLSGRSQLKPQKWMSLPHGRPGHNQTGRAKSLERRHRSVLKREVLGGIIMRLERGFMQKCEVP